MLGQEDPLEEEMATPVFLPGESHGQRSLVGSVHGVAKESDTIDATEHTCMQDKIRKTRVGS